MIDLARVFADYDIELLHIIAARWDVELNTKEPKEAAARLADAMKDPARVADVWSRLDEGQRQALQTVAGSGGGRMQSAIFKRLFGEVRVMGPDRREREKPHLNPANAAEALYYRGLIASALDKTAKGATAYTFVPPDLLALLPTNKTGYDMSAPAPSVPVVEIQPENIRQADTALVDDLTTFLAWCQVNTVALAERSVSPEVQKALKPHLIGTASGARLALMVALGYDLGLIAETDGVWHPQPTTRRFMEARRAHQVHVLAESWLRSPTYNDLWYVPGLKVEPGGAENDPLAARQTVITYLQTVPPDRWWPLDALIAEVKEEEPDYQRINGDYESWYVRDATTGNYLKGFESWDRVDGALLRFIISGVMNGLGLVDTAQNGTLCRLTVYGRALVGAGDWPQPREEQQPKINILQDGSIEIPRAASRYERFQVARFAEWIKAGDPFLYKLSMVGMGQAARQSIQPGQVLAFLNRATDENVPEAVMRLLEAWGAGGSDSPITIEQMTVLRVPTAELLDTIQRTPELRRYLGAELGPTAVAVRADQADQLMDALRAQGLLVERDI